MRGGREGKREGRHGEGRYIHVYKDYNTHLDQSKRDILSFNICPADKISSLIHGLYFHFHLEMSSVQLVIQCVLLSGRGY